VTHNTDGGNGDLCIIRNAIFRTSTKTYPVSRFSPSERVDVLSSKRSGYNRDFSEVHEAT